MFEVTARLKVRDGELEGFKLQAAEIMRQAREKDTKTLRYAWFIADDGTQCEVREGYLDADGLLEHSDHVGEARAKLFRDFAYDHDMTIYGELSSALADVFEAMSDHVAFHRYSLFQGLDTESSRDEAKHDALFEASARLKIRDGELEGFKRQVAEIMRQTQQQDAKPLRYDWFLSDDGTECEVRETYVAADALLEQQRQNGAAPDAAVRDDLIFARATNYVALPDARLEEPMRKPDISAPTAPGSDSERGRASGRTQMSAGSRNRDPR